MRLDPFVLALLAVAVATACTVKAPGKAPSSSPELANGSFVAELNGFRIHYEVHGQGPVLVALTNSWGLSLEALRAMYRPLEERLTLVYFDPRGMGGSGQPSGRESGPRAGSRSPFGPWRGSWPATRVTT